MRIGVIFPQTEIGNDPAAIRDYAQAADELGFSHLFAYEHVLGADPDRPGGWSGVYTKSDAFHEPFVLFGYLAAVTRSIELTTGVLIISQRQTALVAKQAAEVAVLSGGRLRLGIGTGWNQVEYDALGMDFHARGAMQEEQVVLLRRLWTEETIDFKGRFHRVDRAGINPRPARPIPVWFGGGDDRLLRRAARLGDGWMPGGGVTSLSEAMEKMRGYLAAEGRDPATFGFESRLSYTDEPAKWVHIIERWAGLGGTHIAVNVMGAGLDSPQAHIDALRRFRQECASPHWGQR